MSYADGGRGEEEEGGEQKEDFWREAVEGEVWKI